MSSIKMAAVLAKLGKTYIMHNAKSVTYCSRPSVRRSRGVITTRLYTVKNGELVLGEFLDGRFV